MILVIFCEITEKTLIKQIDPNGIILGLIPWVTFFIWFPLSIDILDPILNDKKDVPQKERDWRIDG
jgi:hypothetical protein